MASVNAGGQAQALSYSNCAQSVVSAITLNVSGASATMYRPMNASMSSWTSSNGVVNTLSYRRPPL